MPRKKTKEAKEVTEESKKKTARAREIRTFKRYEDKGIIIDGDYVLPADEKAIKAKEEIRTVEQNYVNASMKDFTENIEKKKNELIAEINNYAQNEMLIKYDEEGNVKSKSLNIVGNCMSEYVINRLFFTSISPLTSKEPKYSAEELAIIFDFYEEMVAKINTEICRLTPSKSHFCRFAGITTATYNGYKQSLDPDMQVVIQKIEDMLSDVHLTLAEENKTNVMAMKYRMNVEMDKRENYNPQVILKGEIKDIDEIQKRIDSLNSIIDVDYEVMEDNTENDE